jgi:hypothetical protein
MPSGVGGGSRATVALSACVSTSPSSRRKKR